MCGVVFWASVLLFFGGVGAGDKCSGVCYAFVEVTDGGARIVALVDGGQLMKKLKR